MENNKCPFCDVIVWTYEEGDEGGLIAYTKSCREHGKLEHWESGQIIYSIYDDIEEGIKAIQEYKKSGEEYAAYNR